MLPEQFEERRKTLQEQQEEEEKQHRRIESWLDQVGLSVNKKKKKTSLTRAHALARRDQFCQHDREQMKNLLGNYDTVKELGSLVQQAQLGAGVKLTEAQATAPNHAPIRSRAQWRNFSEIDHPQYCTQKAPFRTTANNPAQGFAPKCSPQQRLKSCFLNIRRQGRPKHHRCQ